jgi:hypothetical protein
MSQENCAFNLLLHLRIKYPNFPYLLLLNNIINFYMDRIIGAKNNLFTNIFLLFNLAICILLYSSVVFLINVISIAR